MSSLQVGEQTEMTAQSVNGWVKRFKAEGVKGLHTRPGQGRKPIMDCSDEEAVRKAIASDRQSVRAAKEEINLFYGDESHVWSEGYVPYGWKFPEEDIYIPSERAKRLYIFGMIDRDNHFEGFSTCESIDAQKVVDFLEQYSFRVTKKTFVVLDHASVHRNAKIKQMRSVWEKRGLFLFYIPLYSPHLNIIETLWRIMKGKWIRPQDYHSAETLFYATNRILAAIGTELNINYAHNDA
ncbi:MAG: transposase [Tannerellaceae bacterium]|nr:transposase [Tannerellaceae bacterium]